MYFVLLCRLGLDFDLISSRISKDQNVLKNTTRLISEQELVSLFKRTSTDPPTKLKEYKPPTVLGPFAETK